MPIEILMPALSPTMKEGNLTRWLKKEGDKIEPGDIIAEIETDKATMEVESIDEGVLGKILVEGGSRNVPINTLIALILEEDEKPEVLIDYTPKALPSTAAPELKESKAINSPIKSEATKDTKRIMASPLAKRIAGIENVDLNKISGSGPRGRIVKDDVLNAKSAPKAIASATLGRISEEYTLIPNTTMRRVIAQRLTESKQTVPHFYLSVECNIDKLLKARAEMNADAESYKLSINDFIIKAVSMALMEVPEANASWSEEAILQYNNIDISVAVSIEGGLITPIIHNANHKSISSISNEVKSLAKRAKLNELRPEEFQGGGFTISNLGMYGVKNFNAIVNPPQSCILAIGASNKRPVVINDEITTATIMDVSLSCDHRVVDGTVGANFIASFKKFIENPLKMFA